jgi:spore coat polysaccharide biosynthesis protein SpsF
MLGWLLQSLESSERLSRIIIATSDDITDDPIAAYCASVKKACFRGSISNVAERLGAAAELCGAAEFVRISGDSPLISAGVVDSVVKLYEEDEVDLATNTQRRTFPKGVSVEVVRVEALRRAQSLMLRGEEEHVTPVFYRRLHDFRIVNLESGGDWGSVQMSVDTYTDFELAERMVMAASGELNQLDTPVLIALRERCLADMMK